MEPTKILLFAQIIVQILLLGLVVFLLLQEKKRSMPSSALSELKSLVQQTQKLSEDFQQQIQKKVELVSQVTKQLDAKINDAEKAVEGLEKSSSHIKKLRNYTRDDVVKLSDGGFDPVDISQITGIPLGEIQLMIKVNDRDNT